VATAFATNVFPVPGGPYNRIPRNKINFRKNYHDQKRESYAPQFQLAKFCQPEKGRHQVNLRTG
jgi:hypothetical protein